MASTSTSASARLGERVAVIWRSSLLTIAAFGVVMILLGATVLTGVFAGMFGIWGLTIVLVGLGGYIVHQYVYDQ